MKVSVNYNENMSFTGDNLRGHKTEFDSASKYGDNSAATPFEIFLESAAACSAMDVISILKKMKKEVEEFRIEVESERKDEHPKIFTYVKMKYILKSSNTEDKDIERAINLSHEKYCGVSATIRLAGAKMETEHEIIK